MVRGHSLPVSDRTSHQKKKAREKKSPFPLLSDYFTCSLFCPVPCQPITKQRKVQSHFLSSCAGGVRASKTGFSYSELSFRLFFLSFFLYFAPCCILFFYFTGWHFPLYTCVCVRVCAFVIKLKKKGEKSTVSRSLSTSHCTEDLATKLTDSTKGRTQSLICHYGCCIFPEKLFLYSAENMYSIHTHTHARTHAWD